MAKIQSVVATAKGEVAESWRKAVESEERSRMMRKMVQKGIGTNDVENYFGKNCEFLRGGRKGKRQEAKIVQEMRDRLSDNEEDERNCRRRKGIARKHLEDIMGREAKAYRKYIKGVRVKMESHRTILRKKHNEKVRVIKNKKKREAFKLPANLA